MNMNMNSMTLLLGLLPLVVFVVVDSWGGLRWGLLSALVLALLEAIYSYITLGELDIFSTVSLGLVLLMGAVSYYAKSSLWLKMQPVVLGVALGGTLAVSFMMNSPLLFVMMNKYQGQMPPEMQERLLNPLVQEFMKLASLHVGIAILGHALVTAYAALKLSNWWWLAVRGVGFYFFLLLSFLSTHLQLYFRQ